MLYEVGDYVNRNGRHRHTHYIISNSEILGYTPQQRRIIAAIARYLGKSRPTMEDGPMKVVDPGDRANVQKAILLLRLARALNLGRSRAVEKVRISRAFGGGESDAGPPATNGSGPGTLGDRERARLFPRSIRAGTLHCRVVERTQNFGRDAPLQRARSCGASPPWRPRPSSVPATLHSRNR